MNQAAWEWWRAADDRRWSPCVAPGAVDVAMASAWPAVALRAVVMAAAVASAWPAVALGAVVVMVASVASV